MLFSDVFPVQSNDPSCTTEVLYCLHYFVIDGLYIWFFFFKFNLIKYHFFFAFCLFPLFTCRFFVYHDWRNSYFIIVTAPLNALHDQACNYEKICNIFLNASDSPLNSLAHVARLASDGVFLCLFLTHIKTVVRCCMLSLSGTACIHCFLKLHFYPALDCLLRLHCYSVFLIEFLDVIWCWIFKPLPYYFKFITIHFFSSDVKSLSMQGSCFDANYNESAQNLLNTTLEGKRISNGMF